MDKIFQELKLEYKKVDRKWLKVHHFVIVSISILSFILELFIGRILKEAGDIPIPIRAYNIKYILIPSISNLVIILYTSLVVISNRISLRTKILTISLSMVFQAFIIFTVHGTFVSLYFIFTVPIVLSSIYGRYRVTLVTGFLSIFGFIYSELFLRFDGEKIYALENSFVLSSFLLAIVILVVMFVVSLTIIHFDKEKTNSAVIKEIERNKLRKKVKIDDLTKLYNRVALRKDIDKIEEDLSINRYHFVMVDIDNFKLLNDTYGHPEGDNCLIKLAGIMMVACGCNPVYRYGGDEFSIIFRNHSKDQIIKVCKEIQNSFRIVTKQYDDGGLVSLSFGISEFDRDRSPSEMIKSADEALYRSKLDKNSITCSLME